MQKPSQIATAEPMSLHWRRTTPEPAPSIPAHVTIATTANIAAIAIQ